MKKKRGTPENKRYKSELERKFLSHWKKTKIPISQQVIFHPIRKWRFDFAFPDLLLAIEIQGYGRGHADYMSMANDYLKHNEAVRHGWSVLYFMAHDIKDDMIDKTIKYTIDTIKVKTGQPLPQTVKPVRATAEELFRKLHEERRSKGNG